MQANWQASIRCWPLESSAAMESDPDIRDRLRNAEISLQGIEQAYNVRVWCVQRILEAMWLGLSRQETGDEQDTRLNQMAELWLYGLRPAEVELTQPVGPEGSLEQAALRKILELVAAGNLAPESDSDTGIETRAYLKVLLVELGIPTRFEP